MLDWLKAKSNYLETDLHSHLIPGIDDGVKSWDESLDMLKELSLLGYKKIITTPHIIHDYYPNTPDQIRKGVNQLNQKAKASGLTVTIEAGAEYFVDEHFARQVKSDQELLTFGDSYILIETPFMNKPLFLEEVIFNLQAHGLKVIFAHPERYTYIQKDYKIVRNLISLGVFMQININSLTGYYSKEAKKTAQHLIDTSQVHFLASDLHGHKHLTELKKAVKGKLFQKCRQLDLLNFSL